MSYMTKQKKYLMDFFENNKDKQYTVDEIVCLSDKVPKSTVYRIIKSLAEDGLLKTFSSTDSRKTSYQFFREDECVKHFHLKCESCGKILHIDNGFSETLEEMLLKRYGFDVNEKKTMLFGCCESCKSKK